MLAMPFAYTPPPAIVAIGDNRNYIWVLFYSFYTTFYRVGGPPKRCLSPTFTLRVMALHVSLTREGDLGHLLWDLLHGPHFQEALNTREGWSGAFNRLGRWMCRNFAACVLAQNNKSKAYSDGKFLCLLSGAITP